MHTGLLKLFQLSGRRAAGHRQPQRGAVGPVRLARTASAIRLTCRRELGTRARMHTGSTCFKYPGDVPPGPRQMTVSSSCFRY